MRQKIIAGNWKMNGRIEQIVQLINELKQLLNFKQTSKVMVAPPAVYLSLVNELLMGSTIELGAQNVYPKDYGAYTGEVSAPMLKELNCQYVLIGHSERRQYFHESENFIADKFHHVKEHGMIPLLCVGETLTEREAGQTKQVIGKQLEAITAKNNDSFQNCIIAYEPVWAIGTGKTALPEQVQNVHRFIRGWVAEKNNNSAQELPILYGGSVNEHNATALFAMPDVDGGLVGGASLNAKQFVEIVKCIS